MQRRHGLSGLCLGSQKISTTRPNSSRRRLALEHLEDRVVPTIFAPASFTPVGNLPQLLAVGHFNTNFDSHQDVAVTNEEGTYSVLLGDGHGNLTVRGDRIDLPGATGSEGIVAGDFNGDGKDDLAIASYSGQVRILLGIGDGTFSLGGTLALPAGAGPTYLVAGDLTGSGHLDLVVADYNNNGLRVYQGNGDGTFNFMVTLDNNSLGDRAHIANPDQLVLGDFTGSGHLDVAVANQGNDSVTVIRGYGDYTFGQAVNIPVHRAGGGGGRVSPTGLVTGDFTHSGRLDLAVADYGEDGNAAHTVNILQNNGPQPFTGDPSFTDILDINVGQHIINVVAADFSNHGKLDLAVTSAGNTNDPGAPPDIHVHILTNTSGGIGSFSFSLDETANVGRNPVGLVTANLNEDSIHPPDLVNTNQNDPSVSVLLNTTVSSSGPLHVVGNELRDVNGNTVVLRGVNIPSLEYFAPGVNLLQSLGVSITDWHSNLIRLPLNQDYWFGYNDSPQVDPAVRDAYRALVDQVINVARNRHVYMMLDLHWSDMGVWGANNGQHDLPDDHSILFWQDAAQRYANNPAVLFDPYNEPTGIGWDQWHDGGTITEGGTTYQGHGMQEVVNIIRGTGANNIIAPEGIDDGDDFRGITGHYLTDATGNLMYQAHLYPAAAQTNAERDAHVAEVTQFPLFIGEWGADPWGGFFGQAQPDAPTWTRNILAWLSQHQYSWTAWSMNPETRPCLISDWNYTPTDYFGVFVKNALTGAAPGAPGGDPNIAVPTPSLLGVQALAENGRSAFPWTAPQGVSTNSYRGAGSGAECEILARTSVTAVFSTDAAVDRGTTYSHAIAALDEAEESIWSAEAFEETARV